MPLDYRLLVTPAPHPQKAALWIATPMGLCCYCFLMQTNWQQSSWSPRGERQQILGPPPQSAAPCHCQAALVSRGLPLPLHRLTKAFSLSEFSHSFMLFLQVNNSSFHSFSTGDDVWKIQQPYVRFFENLQNIKAQKLYFFIVKACDQSGMSPSQNRNQGDWKKIHLTFLKTSFAFMFSHAVQVTFVQRGSQVSFSDVF